MLVAAEKLDYWSKSGLAEARYGRCRDIVIRNFGDNAQIEEAEFQNGKNNRDVIDHTADERMGDGRMKSTEEILDYYKNILKWDPPFAQALSKHCPDGLNGYLTMREAAQNGPLPAKTRELIFMILDSIDNEVSGACAHAATAVEAGMTVEEIVQTFVIVTIVRGINVLCMAGVEAIQTAEKKADELGKK